MSRRVTRCLPFFVVVAAACGEETFERLPEDQAVALSIEGGGSKQNPCFGPDSAALVFTRWHGGYNRGRATVERIGLEGGEATLLSSSDGVSVNLPGSCWHPEAGIVFSTDVYDDRDEIYLMDPGGGEPRALTSRPGFVAFEPSLSPDGEWVVFESHVLDVEGDGALFKVRTDGTELTELTDGSMDDRQPNWSPRGDVIVFQSHGRESGNIELFTMNPDGGDITNVTRSESEDTDASFSPDGSRIVYSSDHGGLELANLFVVEVDGGEPERITFSTGYDGAPTWSPDGRTIAFESRLGDPDDSSGTTLFTIDAP